MARRALLHKACFLLESRAALRSSLLSEPVIALSNALTVEWYSLQVRVLTASSSSICEQGPDLLTEPEPDMLFMAAPPLRRFMGVQIESTNTRPLPRAFAERAVFVNTPRPPYRALPDQ